MTAEADVMLLALKVAPEAGNDREPDSQQILGGSPAHLEFTGDGTMYVTFRPHV